MRKSLPLSNNSHREKERFTSVSEVSLEKAGGHVSQNRVNGQLAVSRALGDFEMKRNNACDQISQLVSPEADVTGKVTRIY